MKKILAVLLSTIVFCTCVQAQNDTNVNPLNVARAFALKTPEYFECHLSGSALVSNTWQQVDMRFVLRKGDFAITNLSINGTSIPLPEPIYGLPLGDGGVIRNVYAHANAYTKDGQYAGYGYGQSPQLLAGGRIEVILQPADIVVELPIDVSQYDDGDIDLEIENFIYGYGYGESGGKFYVSLPPVGGRYHYILRQRSTGQTIGEGWLEPFKSVTTTKDGYYGIGYIGNVMSLDFRSQSGEDWIGIPIPEFNCSVPTTGGTNVMGKVFFANVGTGGLELVIGMDAYVYVQQVTENGDMPFLSLEDRSVHYESGYTETRVNTTAYNVGKVVVSIIPKGPVDDGNHWLNVHRFYGTPSSGGGGGIGVGSVSSSTITTP